MSVDRRMLRAREQITTSLSAEPDQVVLGGKRGILRLIRDSANASFQMRRTDTLKNGL